MIVIDPGHGGSDPGALHNGLDRERSQSRHVAPLARPARRARLDRQDDARFRHRRLPAQRFGARRTAGARRHRQRRCTRGLFISVHSNALPSSSSSSGTTTYYYKADSYAFARAVHARLAADLADQRRRHHQGQILRDRARDDAGDPVETAFLSNPRDAALLRDPAFLQKVALAIAEGVGAYAAAPPPVSQAHGAADGGRALDILGIFDSGLGGLTVLRAVRALLPRRRHRLLCRSSPRSVRRPQPDELARLLAHNVAYLEARGVDAIVMGCNTSCAIAASRGWPPARVPILDLIDAAADAVMRLAARAGSASSAPRRRSARAPTARDSPRATPAIDVQEVAAPALVPLVESGVLSGPLARDAVARGVRAVRAAARRARLGVHALSVARCRVCRGAPATSAHRSGASAGRACCRHRSAYRHGAAAAGPTT